LISLEQLDNWRIDEDPGSLISLQTAHRLVEPADIERFSSEAKKKGNQMKPVICGIFMDILNFMFMAKKSGL